jgi:hypothetical protein|tara:strand:+ start:474 stop:1658 length:1185 start_codon:yes stop_codon:yes gene_type:complete
MPDPTKTKKSKGSSTRLSPWTSDASKKVAQSVSKYIRGMEGWISMKDYQSQIQTSYDDLLANPDYMTKNEAYTSKGQRSKTNREYHNASWKWNTPIPRHFIGAVDKSYIDESSFIGAEQFFADQFSGEDIALYQQDLSNYLGVETQQYQGGEEKPFVDQILGPNTLRAYQDMRYKVIGGIAKGNYKGWGKPFHYDMDFTPDKNEIMKPNVLDNTNVASNLETGTIKDTSGGMEEGGLVPEESTSIHNTEEKIDIGDEEIADQYISFLDHYNDKMSITDLLVFKSMNDAKYEKDKRDGVMNPDEEAISMATNGGFYQKYNSKSYSSRLPFGDNILKWLPSHVQIFTFADAQDKTNVGAFAGKEVPITENISANVGVSGSTAGSNINKSAGLTIKF